LKWKVAVVVISWEKEDSLWGRRARDIFRGEEKEGGRDVQRLRGDEIWGVWGLGSDEIQGGEDGIQ